MQGVGEIDAELKLLEEEIARDPENEELKYRYHQLRVRRWVDTRGKHFGGKRKKSKKKKSKKGKRKTYKRKNKRSKRIRKSRRSFIKKTRTKKSKKRN